MRSVIRENYLFFRIFAFELIKLKMDKDTFLQLLTDEVNTYKSLMETDCGDWIVKGFIDIDKNVYTITNDTKVVSKIIEIMLIPRLNDFAVKIGRAHV